MRETPSMRKLWHEEAWAEYLGWQGKDRKTLRRINLLLESIDRNGYDCIGKPEPLRHGLAGWWSVRINDADRLVFRIVEDRVEILACLGHYD